MTHPEDPIDKFNQWWRQALASGGLKQKSAVCVTTINADGFPSGRFVDLKAVDHTGFTFCTSLNSDKGRDLRQNPKAGMTIWWDHVGYQVRVTGGAVQLCEQTADEYWQTRSRDAQITTSCIGQSQELKDPTQLEPVFAAAKADFHGKPIPKPEQWGGYTIEPIAIEFLTFRKNRLHLRELYQQDQGAWHKSYLNP